MSESTYDKTWYAANGSKLVTKNLNADSDHPNPWRPRNAWEVHVPSVMNDMRITERGQPTMNSIEMEFETAGLARNLFYWGKLGLKFGTTHSILDIMNVSRIPMTNPMGIIGRWAYISTPWVGMFTAAPATFHLLNEMNEKKNQDWMYWASAAPSGAIWGVFRRSFGVGCLVAATGGLIGYCYKKGHEYNMFGPMQSLLKYDMPDIEIRWNDPLNNEALPVQKVPNYWMTGDKPMWPVRNPNEEPIEPSWKKHLPPEDRNKGPPTGL